MRCSIVRKCGAEAAYYLRLADHEPFRIEVAPDVYVEPSPGVIAFACLMHMERSLDNGVPPEVFWSLPSKEVPEGPTTGVV
jgi:hypothetical protein